MGEFGVYRRKAPRPLENGYSTDRLIKSLDDAELLRHMGVPPRYWGFAPGMADQPLHPVIEGWIDDLPSIYRPGPEAEKPAMCGVGLILHGPSRTRKTTAASALLLRLVRMGIHNNDPGGYNRWDGWCMGSFQDWQYVSALMRDAVRDDEAAQLAKEAKQSMMSMGPHLTQANFLVLDDLSRERGSDFNLGELSRILRHRGDYGYPTILTTNFPPDQWESAYSEALAGYMSDVFVSVEFTR